MRMMLAGQGLAFAKLVAAQKEVRKAVRRGSRAGAKIVQAEAKRNAPVDTGALVAGIKVRSIKRSRRYIGTNCTIRVKGGVKYAGFQEYGTKRNPATKYMTKAVKSQESSAMAAFSAAITTAAKSYAANQGVP
jgi:HK97 gp10 family phage protein